MAFVGLVGLYACNVRRLRTEKRNAAHFLGLLRSIGLIGFCSCLYCCCFAPVLCLLWLCCWWLSFPSDGMTKRKGAPPLVLPLFVRGLCLILSYCVGYYETIAGCFYPQGVTDYPRGCKLVAIVAYYLTSVAVLVFHYHSTLIECSCFACAGVFVSFVNIPDAATLISVNICLRSLCVVV